MKNKLALTSAAAALFALIFSSEKVIESSRYALSLCINNIIPSLLPFFIVSILLNRLGLPYYLGRLFSAHGTGASAFFIGITGGYPLGAAYIADMYKNEYISLTEAERLLAFCNNSGPAFIIGAVGTGVFHSGKAGLILYCSHVLAALSAGIIFSRRKKEEAVHTDFTPLGFSRALSEAVPSAVASALNVCGFIICFSVFTALLDTSGYFSLVSAWLSELINMELHWSRALLTGIFELGSAAGVMKGLIPNPVNMSLAAAILGWGGISVHFQTFAVISDTNIKGTLHLAGRLISCVFSAVLAYFGAMLI